MEGERLQGLGGHPSTACVQKRKERKDLWMCIGNENPITPLS